MAVSQSNSPKNLDMMTMIAKLDALGSVAKGCRFAVKIEPYNNSVISSIGNLDDLLYMCDAAELPGRGFSMMETRYYGASLAFPNNSTYQGANFSFICRSESPERKFFDDWMELINPTSNFNFEYPEKYYAQIKIFQFAEYGRSGTEKNLKPWSSTPNQQTYTQESGTASVTPTGYKQDSSGYKTDVVRGADPLITYGWTLRRAWPVLVNPQQVTWIDNDILRLQVSFAYRYWDRDDFKTQ